MTSRSPLPDAVVVACPAWFDAFLSDRGTRKPSPHTIKAYRQDFLAIAVLLAGGIDGVAELSPSVLTKKSMRSAFAAYAKIHQAASILRCWSTWNVLCTYLFADDVIPANPMPAVGRPKIAKTLPKAFPPEAVASLLETMAAEVSVDRRNDWPERDGAIVLTALLTGMRSDELIRANVGDIGPAGDAGAVIHVRGKGNKERRIPIEQELIDVLVAYLVTRAARFPTAKPSSGALTSWPRTAPLFVGPTGERITRGTLQYRVQRAYRRAGVESQRERGALVHGLRHTYATSLANENVSVYTLMKLLGHESMSTAQRYVSGAGTDTRPAAAHNPVYRLLKQHNEDGE